VKRKIILFLFLLEGVIMGAVLDKVKVKGENIPLIYENSSNLPIVFYQLVFRKSGALENTKAGLAKFSANMLNQGTKRLGNVGFAMELEKRAINFSIHSGIETFTIEFSALKSEFNAALRLIKELLKEPNLSDKAFEKVKTNTIGYLKRKENDYDYIASKNLKKILFPKTPLENPLSGDYESIEKITLSDIKSFLKNHLVLKRVVVVAGGDISIEKTKKYSKELLEILDKGKDEILPFYNASKEQKEQLVKKDETKQAYIYFGSPFYLKIKDADSYKARVASYILGAGGFGSRLMEEIRVKKGLAYSAYGRINLNKSHSYFSGYLQTKLSSKEEAVKVVKETIKEFVEKGVTQNELDSAKKFLIGSEPLRNETLAQRLNRAFLLYYYNKPFDYHKEELKKIEALTLEELNSFIKNHKEILLLSFSIVAK
jgi:predicted Zn-dependent peptidase